MTTRDSEHVDELIGGYLLGALEVGEPDLVAEHLATCEECTRIYIETRELLSALPDQLDELAPRPHVKAALLDAARRSLPEGGAPGVTLLDEERSRRSGFAQWAPLVAAAAAVIAIIVGLAAWGIVLDSRLDDRDTELASAQDALGAIATSSRVLTMKGTDAAPGVHAALIVPADEGGVYVLANNVPQPAAGTGYHLWLFEGDDPVSGGVLSPDDEGNVAVRIPGVDLAAFDRMEVDVQPLGSDAPGGTTVLGGDLN